MARIVGPDTAAGHGDGMTSEPVGPIGWLAREEQVKKDLLVSNLAEGEDVGQYLSPWEARVYLISEAVVNGSA